MVFYHALSPWCPSARSRHGDIPSCWRSITPWPQQICATIGGQDTALVPSTSVQELHLPKALKYTLDCPFTLNINGAELSVSVEGERFLLFAVEQANVSRIKTSGVGSRKPQRLFDSNALVVSRAHFIRSCYLNQENELYGLGSSLG